MAGKVEAAEAEAGGRFRFATGRAGKVLRPLSGSGDTAVISARADARHGIASLAAAQLPAKYQLERFFRLGRRVVKLGGREEEVLSSLLFRASELFIFNA